MCPNCSRTFQKTKQPHSCKRVSVESHFENKEKAKELFNYLLRKIEEDIGKCKIISLPCCIHLFGNYDFLAALPKKEKLEIRFALNRGLDSPRLNQSVSVSASAIKNCIDITMMEEIDKELMGWLSEAYFLKEKTG